MTKEKSMFKMPYEQHKGEPTPAGTKMENEYSYVINSKGQKVLEKTGETNRWEKIQEEYEDTKIENILAKAAVGDMTHFRPEGIYADISEAPKSLIEARQQMQKLENLWANVPQEIKNNYNNDVEEFIAASGTDRWLEDMGIIGAEIEEAEKQMAEAPSVQPLGQVEKGEVVNES